MPEAPEIGGQEGFEAQPTQLARAGDVQREEEKPSHFATGTAVINEAQKKDFSLEIMGEAVLLAGVGGFFIYVLVLSFDWNLGAALTPLIAVGIGMPFLILRIIYVARVWRGVQGETMSAGEIMDVGFRIGADPKAERQRFIKIIAAIAILYLGLWLVGFHIMLPLWTFVYMYLVGKARFIWSALVTLLFVAIIVGVYDYLLGVIWSEPLLFRLFR
jgi:hypothetical protein